MDRSKVYKEMCRFLADQEQTLQEFKAFHEKHCDKSDYEELFDESYGAMYDSFFSTEKEKASPTTPQIAKEKQTINYNPSVANLPQEEYYNDVRIIRRWVQFFGWLTVISIVTYAIFLIVTLSQL